MMWYHVGNLFMSTVIRRTKITKGSVLSTAVIFSSAEFHRELTRRFPQVATQISLACRTWRIAEHCNAIVGY